MVDGYKGNMSEGRCQPTMGNPRDDHEKPPYLIEAGVRVGRLN